MANFNFIVTLIIILIIVNVVMGGKKDFFQNYKEINYNVDYEDVELENGDIEKINYILPKKSKICNKNNRITTCMNNDCIKFNDDGDSIIEKSISNINKVYDTKSLNSISCDTVESTVA